MYIFCGYQIFAPESKHDKWETAAVAGGRYNSFDDAKKATAMVVRAELKQFALEVENTANKERELYRKLHKKYGKK
jgi:hypothetical protein